MAASGTLPPVDMARKQVALGLWSVPDSKVGVENQTSRILFIQVMDDVNARKLQSFGFGVSAEATGGGMHMQAAYAAAKTTCAFVMGVYGDSKDPMGKAQAAFEGGFGKSGEYTDSPALQRVFTSFEDVEPNLNHWATRLYEPMFKAAKVIHLNADNAEEAGA